MRDMRFTIAHLCNADAHTVVQAYARELGDNYTTQRETVTVADCLRWYEQSPKDEVQP